MLELMGAIGRFKRSIHSGSVVFVDFHGRLARHDGEERAEQFIVQFLVPSYGGEFETSSRVWQRSIKKKTKKQRAHVWCLMLGADIQQ